MSGQRRRGCTYPHTPFPRQRWVDPPPHTFGHAKKKGVYLGTPSFVGEVDFKRRPLIRLACRLAVCWAPFSCVCAKEEGGVPTPTHLSPDKGGWTHLNTPLPRQRWVGLRPTPLPTQRRIGAYLPPPHTPPCIRLRLYMISIVYIVKSTYERKCGKLF